MPEFAATLTAVTVYPDRARVTRTGRAALQPGLHHLEFSGLPLKLIPDSLRAAARGAARARLLGVQLQRVYFVETPAEQVQQLEDQLQARQDEMRALEAQAALVKQYRQALDALSGQTEIYATALAAGETSLASQLALFDGLRARAESLDREQLKISAAQRLVERQISKLQKDYEQQRSARPRERYVAVVAVEVLQEGDLQVELSYVVSAAGWRPLYDLRLVEDSEVPVLEVGYLAEVSQQTGEPWEAVVLTLSTARPALAGRLPELDPWFIQPIPVPRPIPARQIESAPVAQARLAAAGPPAPLQFQVEEAEIVTASVDSSAAAITYRVPGTVSAPSGGEPHKVTVARFNLNPRLDYVTAPRLVPAAYRRARLTNDSPYTLLPGRINLFAGAEFIGSTNVELVPPQGQLELYLGIDDRLKVERELKRREVDKKVIGGRRRIRYAYEITLENHLPFETRVTLHDQLPVSRHEDLKVRLESADPRPNEQSELNLLDWDFTLAPQEKRLVRFDFTVEHPAAMDVAGLP